MPEPWALTVAELAEALRSRRLTAVETASAFLERARLADAHVNCFVELGQGALEAADRLDRHAATEAPLGRLHGVPFAQKDLLVDEGRSPTGGSRRVRLPLRATGSTVLERLEADGAVSLGPLNLDPFAYAATGLNPELGDVRNPWDTGRIAGGSSGGAAAAVAAGAVPFAIGSDTGGSIRIPAGFCGVTGLKPTYGLVPKRGTLPVSYSQDTLGVIARSALDVAFVLESLAGHDPLDASSLPLPRDRFAGLSEQVAPQGERPLAGLRVGVVSGAFADRTGAEVAGAAADAVAVLAGLGAEVTDLQLPDLDRCDAAATVLTWAEVAAVHRPAFVRAPELYASSMRARLEVALAVGGTGHVDALRYQGRALRTFLDGVLAAVDVVVAPTVDAPPPTLAAAAGGEAHAAALSLRLLRLNRPFSYLGVPALALPTGFGAAGLPTAVQLVGRPWAEPTLLRVAAAYQAATDWHRRLPPLAAASVDNVRPPANAPDGRGERREPHSSGA